MEENLSSITYREHLASIIHDRQKTVIAQMPRAIKLEISSKCNLNCSICAYEKSYLHELMTDSDFEIAKKNIFDIQPQEVGVLFLGESTLHPNLPKYISDIKQQVQYVFLSTNGIEISKQYVNELLKSGLNSLKWSVNYCNSAQFQHITRRKCELFYSLLDIIKYAFAARKLLSSNTKLYASYVYDDIVNDETLQFMKEKIVPFVDEVVYNKKTNHAGLLDGKQCSFVADGKIPCPRLFNTAYIRSNLDVVCCCNGYTEDFIVGSLHDNTLREIWNNDKMQKLRMMHIRNCIEKCVCANN